MVNRDPGDRQVADKSLGDIQGADKDQRGWQQSSRAHNLLRYMMGEKGKLELMGSLLLYTTTKFPQSDDLIT